MAKQNDIEKDDELYELKNIRVKEVSVVDRAANKRRFLLMKRNDDGTKTEDARAEARAAIHERDPEMAAKDAADAAEYKARKEAEEAAAAAAASTETIVVPETAPAAAPVVEAEKVETAPVVENTAPAAETAVTNEAPAAAAPAAAAPVVKETLVVGTRAKAALKAAIGAIHEQLDILTGAVDKAEPTETGMLAYSYPVYEHIENAQRMLASLCHIGGPEWEVHAAAVASVASKKDEKVEKVGRAISSVRVTKLRDIHGKIEAVQKAMTEFLSEVDSDQTEEAPAAKKEDVSAPPPVVETKKEEVPPAPVIPEAVTKMADQLERLTKVVSSLSESANRSRTVVQSNVIQNEPVVKREEKVYWPPDLASPAARFGGR